MWQSQGAALTAQCELDGDTGDQCRLSRKLLADFKGVNYGWLLMVMLAYLLSCVIRAMRWKDMLRPMGYEVSLFNSFAAVMVGYFANLGVPRLGELLRPTILARYEDVGIEKAFGTIVTERIIDVLLFGVMIGLGFIFHFENLWKYIVENSSITGNQLFITLAILTVGGVFGIYILRKIITLENDKLSPIAKKIKNLISGFAEGLISIRKLPSPGKFIFQSILIWALYFLMHYFAFFAYDPVSHLSMADAILVFDFGSLGIVLPSPGGMGTYHFLIVESLKILGVDAIAGFSFAMISFFTLNIGCNVLFGILSLIGLPIINKR